MDAELSTILANIKSLVDQAGQISGGGAEKQAEMEGAEEKEEMSPDVAEKIMKFLKEMDEPEKKEEKPGEVEKAAQEKVSPPDKGVDSPASSGAAAVIDETTPEQEKNLNEIARALVGAMAKKSIKKSQESNELNAVKEEMNEIKKSLENILSGLGVADKIKQLEVEKSKEVRRPVNDPNEIKKSLDYIKGQLGIQVQDNRPMGNQSESVHKSLANALTSLVSNK